MLFLRLFWPTSVVKENAVKLQKCFVDYDGGWRMEGGGSAETE